MAQVTVRPAETPHSVQGCELAYNYKWDARTAAAICEAESGGASDRVGDDYVIAGIYAPSCGLMQIRTLDGRPSCDELKDPTVNMEWAYKISNGGTDWTPWSVYNNGNYRKFLQ